MEDYHGGESDLNGRWISWLFLYVRSKEELWIEIEMMS